MVVANQQAAAPPRIVGRYALFDRGCMDVQYLPTFDVPIPPEAGDLVVIARCGAYTYSLWSDFGAPRPEVVAYESIL